MKVMSLANIEKRFVGRLLKSQGNDAGFLSELLPLHSISKEKQLSIYRSNVNGSHQKVLGQVYPACLNVLGEDYFNQLCRVYRFEHPSTDADLNNYGEYFSLFLNEQLELHQELIGLEYLADLACLEWHWHASYYAKDDETFSFEKLALVEADVQDKIYFRVSDSFSLHSSIYPLLEIWNANKNLVENIQEFHMPESESYFCISRKEFSPVVDLLDYEQYILLKSLSDGMSLVQLTELDSVYDFENKLMSFIQQGWITGFYLQD